jgi:alpha-tubulin suppressor-like RCC1 family protein
MSIFKNTLTTNTQQELVKAGCLIYTSAPDPVCYLFNGRNTDGASGLNASVTSCCGYSSPVLLPGAWASIVGHVTTSDGFHGVKTDGTLWSWGYNGDGHHGTGNTTNTSSPVQVPGTTWSRVTGGSGSTVALKTDGTLWHWGRNAPTGRVSSPVQIAGTTWCAIASGAYSKFGIKTDGTLWSWSRNYGGSLGTNQSVTYVSSPIQIPGTTWCKVFDMGGRGANVAQKTDNTTWVWGRNANGTLGDSTVVNKSSPIQIPGTWTKLTGTWDSTYGVKSNGTLWFWGCATSGSSGLNVASCIVSSPVQIPGTTWCDVEDRSRYGAPWAAKTDGTLWRWGYNYYPFLATNDIADRSSPIQLPGTWLCAGVGGTYSHYNAKQG